MIDQTNPFDVIEAAIVEIEWGDRDRDPHGACPSCGRSNEGYNGRHALGCAIRTLREQVARIPEIYFS